MPGPEVTVVVEQSPDWFASVVLPAAAILISAAIALLVARSQLIAAHKSRVRHQTAQLIGTLHSYARALLTQDPQTAQHAHEAFEREVNVFATYLNKKDVPIAKFVTLVAMRAMPAPWLAHARVVMWLSASLELWARGALPRRFFSTNMPPNEGAWIEYVDLSEWRAVVSGETAHGIDDLDKWVK